MTDARVTGEALSASADCVTLRIPARADLWILARLTVSAIASRLDFSIIEIEDLRLAIDELCTLCAEGLDESGSLQVRIRWMPDVVDVQCDATPGPTALRVFDEGGSDRLELSARILDALVDRHEIAPTSDGHSRGSFQKVRHAG